MDLKIFSDGGTRLVANLFSLDEKSCYFYENYDQHPYDLFEQEISTFYNNQKSLIRSIEIFDELDPNKSESVRTYFLQLNKLYEIFLKILQAASPASDYKSNDTGEWLKKERNEDYKKFKGAVITHHKRIRKIANKLKHTGIQINFIKIKNYRNRYVQGFYISDVVGSDNLVGPDPELHPKYKGMPTAMSYNYCIKYGLGFISLGIFWLNKILFGEEISLESKNFSQLYDLFFDGLSCEGDFFPDEYGMTISKILNKESSLIINFPYRFEQKKCFDNIKSSEPFFKFNSRTLKANNQWPYLGLLVREIT